MEKSAEALERWTFTLDTYKKNKTEVAPEDLSGKYKKAYDRLRQKLKKELENYLLISVFGGLKIKNNGEGQQLAARMNQIWQESQAEAAVSQAAFRDMDVQKVRQAAAAMRKKMLAVYQEYFDRHTCLYAAGPSWDLNNPQPPLIYNDILDKVYESASGVWVKKPDIYKAAVLIYVKEDKDG